jgi:hypothetical protein
MTRYEITASSGRTTLTERSLWKRLAIRRCRKMVKQLGEGSRGSVSKPRFGLVYQCHLKNGALVAEEL